MEEFVLRPSLQYESSYGYQIYHSFECFSFKTFFEFSFYAKVLLTEMYCTDSFKKAKNTQWRSKPIIQCIVWIYTSLRRLFLRVFGFLNRNTSLLFILVAQSRGKIWIYSSSILKLFCLTKSNLTHFRTSLPDGAASLVKRAECCLLNL